MYFFLLSFIVLDEDSSLGYCIDVWLLIPGTDASALLVRRLCGAGQGGANASTRAWVGRLGIGHGAEGEMGWRLGLICSRRCWS